MNKSSILWRIECIKRILEHGPMSAREITEKLYHDYGIEKNERTIIRDLNDSLGKNGIRKHGEPAHRTKQMWTVSTEKRDRTRQPPDFNEPAALATLLAERHLEGIRHPQLMTKLEPLFKYAHEMLEHNAENRGLIANWNRSVEYTPSDHQLQAPKIEPKLFEQLLRDVFNRSVIDITYVRHQGDEPIKRRGNALGIVYRGRVPYLAFRYLKRNPDDKDFTAFLPISRILGVQGVVSDSQEVKDFNLAEAKEKQFNMTIGDDFTLEMQIFDSVRREIQDAHLGKNQVIRPIEGHPTIFLLQVDVPYNQNLVNWLIARSPYLKVLGPKPFRRMFYRDIKRAAAIDDAEFLTVPPREEKTFVSFEEEEKRHSS
ncbi:helix-turn-helix transcriptional regulator [Pseudidiomarina insulisalsae]|nr:WYL domain-containing protein [Pseudidiomarina insulisalsae]